MGNQPAEIKPNLPAVGPAQTATPAGPPTITPHEANPGEARLIKEAQKDEAEKPQVRTAYPLYQPEKPATGTAG